MDHIIKIVKSLEYSGLLIDGATKRVKHEKKKQKKQEGGFLVAMMAYIVASLINAMFRKEVMKAGKKQKGGSLPLLALPLIVKVLGKVVTPAGTQRPEDVPLWSCFGRDVPHYKRNKIGRIRFLTYFGSAMCNIHLVSGKVKNIFLKTYFMDDD